MGNRVEPAEPTLRVSAGSEELRDIGVIGSLKPEYRLRVGFYLVWGRSDREARLEGTPFAIPGL